MSPAGWAALFAGVALAFATGTGCEMQPPRPAKDKPAAVKASPTPPAAGDSGGATRFFPDGG
jgi:hypothetical protein